MTESANADQADYWSGPAGEKWARFQARLDRQLDPLGKAAMRALAPRLGERVLDVGCGCGHTTLQLAEQVGDRGRVLGVDVSGPMLAVARQRAGAAPHVNFAQADAQTAELGFVPFDAVYSRFGVMFFNDPPAAFANLRAAMRPGGRLGFVCWRPYAENRWMREPMEAAEKYLPPSEPSDPLAPGPFAFADPARVRAILEGAGFSEVGIEGFDTPIGGGNLEDSLELSFNIGPLGSALREHPDKLEDVRDEVRKVLERYVTPDGVKIPAAVWIVRATNP
jgi:ubiquinone/menaquinone biosynthesis C-methylase UbiE